MATPVSYARVARTFWTDPDIKRRLSPEQKELLLYFFTSPHGNMVGLYYLPFEYAAFETGLALDDIDRWTADELADFVTYDPETEEILVHRAAVHQIGPELKPGDNRAKAIDRILVDAHSPLLVRRFLDLYPDWPITDPLKGASEGASEGPSKPDAVAVADAVTDTGSSSIDPPPPTDVGEFSEKASKAIIAANKGMGDNPRIGKRLRPIPTSHGSRTYPLEWLTDGIPWDVIGAVVYDRAKTYEPDDRHRQISTMKYFDKPVREEWDRIQAQNMEAPSANGSRAAGGAQSKGRGEAAGDGGGGDYGHLG